ncbi:MAG: type I-E CRISPR-associated protein Cas6/Cse3/CasE [Lactobacillus sp.]
MYLSRVQIDVNNRQKTKDLSHLGAFHNWVEQSFPEEIAQSKRKRHLWRIDQLSGKLYLLVLSENRPDQVRLGQYGVPVTVVTKEYDHFLDQLHNHQIVQFRLTANPTHRSSNTGDKKSHIFAHVTVGQQKQWLIAKAKNSGFVLTKKQVKTEMLDNQWNFDIVNRDWPILARKHTHVIRLSRVTFEGELEITNVEQFKLTLVKGIGREKAFGMGLMTVIPRR